MKTTQISTQAISEATRLSRMRLQLQLSDGQKEATTGRLADVGQGLGYLTGRSVSLRQDLDRLNTFKDTNAIATTRLQQTQTALEGIADLAQEFISTLVAARASAASAEVAVADARTKLIALTSAMNNAANGAFLFSGINTDVKPLTDYFETPTPANRTAVATEFTTRLRTGAGRSGHRADYRHGHDSVPQWAVQRPLRQHELDHDVVVGLGPEHHFAHQQQRAHRNVGERQQSAASAFWPVPTRWLPTSEPRP